MPLHGDVAAGRVALVDEEDYELVSQYRWHASKVPASRTFYARTKITHPDGSKSDILMHNLLTGWKRVDHVNHNGLDNQRHNLRLATHKQNLANRQPNINSKWSRYKGVSWDSRRSKWTAKIQAEGNRRRLGSFESEKDAARAYNAAALATYGIFAYLNDVSD